MMTVATHSVVRMGSRSPDVVRLQTLLNAKLMPPPSLRVDGSYGARTETAVRQFQRLNRLTADGVVGPRTWAALEGQDTASLLEPEPRWLQIARGEIGVREIPGSQHNPKIIAYHATTTLTATTDETAWCSSFVNWCLARAGIMGSNSAAAASWLGWGANTTARTGAITVIYNAAAANSNLSRSGNHVGFLVKESPSHFTLLGGNQSDQVKESSFGKGAWQLKGHRWPLGS